MDNYNKFIRALKRALCSIEEAATYIGDTHLDELLIKCDFDMDCAPEIIVLDYLERYYRFKLD